MAKSIAYIKVKVYLGTDLEDDEIASIAEEVEYEFNHQWISHTEIKSIE